MNANNAHVPIWQILAAIVSGLLLPVLIGGAIVIARGELGFASSDVASAERPRDKADNEHQLRLGIVYVPPAKTPDMRLYIEEGFETDLAREIGERLHADVKLVLVPPADRLAALNENRVDAVLARIADDDPLRKAAEILPTGYESGLSPVMRSDRPLRQWSDFKDRVVCVTLANNRGQKLAQSLGAEVRTLRAPAEALMLVRTGECMAAIHDRAVLDPLFTKRSWQKFSATLPPVDPTSLVIVVATHRTDLAIAIRRALTTIGSAEQWQQRRERWAELASFEVYRDQAGPDCH
ncbi:transporter substrate-binding domain-containing protein [Bradyrhizobium sp. Arg237L]|uniref:transporter substrate-binding domain-containing protein n=1 Tax=Bradyrhizobium sp. Arg237L TaxID=3003352 RepID=UPI00249E978D|nr:transporter substrate-binding domain-containing protein [Bradyrhizobium sp. Arg237L]MDI4234063.1 transporter substrate-binding domain-containing protein [Bradyrhizobium sp. Arg237L]